MKIAGAALQISNGLKAEAPPMRVRLSSRQLMTLPEQIAEHIFAAIERGEYAPGERIREETLAEQFEVSRGPVREALRILEKDSVVDIVPNRGAHVTQLSIKEVRDIFEIRRDLIGAMVRRLDRRNASFIASIAADVRELESLVKEPDAGDAYLAVSDRLGRLLADGAGNERLAAILGSLARQTRRYSRLGLATAARRQRIRPYLADVLEIPDGRRRSQRRRGARKPDRRFDAGSRQAVAGGRQRHPNKGLTPMSSERIAGHALSWAAASFATVPQSCFATAVSATRRSSGAATSSPMRSSAWASVRASGSPFCSTTRWRASTASSAPRKRRRPMSP